MFLKFAFTEFIFVTFWITLTNISLAQKFGSILTIYQQILPPSPTLLTLKWYATKDLD